jgi:hypothetical protein
MFDMLQRLGACRYRFEQETVPDNWVKIILPSYFNELNVFSKDGCF